MPEDDTVFRAISFSRDDTGCPCKEVHQGLNSKFWRDLSSSPRREHLNTPMTGPERRLLQPVKFSAKLLLALMQAVAKFGNVTKLATAPACAQQWRSNRARNMLPAYSSSCCAGRPISSGESSVHCEIRYTGRLLPVIRLAGVPNPSGGTHGTRNLYLSAKTEP